MKLLKSTVEVLFQVAVWSTAIFGILSAVAMVILVDRANTHSEVARAKSNQTYVPQILDNLMQRYASLKEIDKFAGTPNKTFYEVFSLAERWAYIAATMDSWSYQYRFLDNENGAWVDTCLSSRDVDPVEVEKASALAFAAAAPDRPAVESVFVALMIVCFKLNDMRSDEQALEMPIQYSANDNNLRL